jgi:hypothetical protein
VGSSRVRHLHLPLSSRPHPGLPHPRARSPEVNAMNTRVAKGSKDAFNLLRDAVRDDTPNG